MLQALAQAGQFLAGVGQAAGGLSSFGQLLGIGKDRISNRDYQFYQDLADSGNPREIKRQNEYLAGVTPTQIKAQNDFLAGTTPTQIQTQNDFTSGTIGSEIDAQNRMTRETAPVNAEAYNQYQDMTFGEDTRRAQERMDTLYAGTSPWERLGIGPANPIPSASYTADTGSPGGVAPGGRGDPSAFLSQLVPIKTAEIASRTALAQTAMQNRNAIELENIRQGKGNLAKSQISLNKANEAATALTSKASADLMSTQAAVADNRAVLDTIQTFIQALPEQVVDLGIIQEKSRPGAKAILKLADQAPKFPNVDELQAAIKNMTETEWSGMKKDIMEAASLFVQATKGAGAAAKGAMDFVYGTKTFLHGLTHK